MSYLFRLKPATISLKIGHLAFQVQSNIRFRHPKNGKKSADFSMVKGKAPLGGKQKMQSSFRNEVSGNKDSPEVPKKNQLQQKLAALEPPIKVAKNLQVVLRWVFAVTPPGNFTWVHHENHPGKRKEKTSPKQRSPFFGGFKKCEVFWVGVSSLSGSG